jgi:hypothetical protein
MPAAKAAWVRLPLRELKPNPDNPRVIKDDKFRKLVQSIREFPQMLELRPIVVNGERVVLGGNMRLKACKEAGLKDVPVVIADDLTPAQQREFVVKDNASFGEWDWDAVANEWAEEPLEDWGLDVPEPAFDEPEEKDSSNPYTLNIEAPVYKPSGPMPSIEALADRTKSNALCARIDASNARDDIKAFLRLAAMRHVVFSYEQIAEYYAHAPADVQELMEESALVIIDFNKAIEHGYVKLSQKIASIFEDVDDAEDDAS